MRKMLMGLLAVAIAATVTVPAATSKAGKQVFGVDRADIMGQGGQGVAAANGATLFRSFFGLHIRMEMPTPEPGEYTYPAAAPGAPPIVPGWPEVFTGWAFVFNFPEKCTGNCDLDDLGPGAAAQGGVYNFDGQLIWRDTLTLTGFVKRGALSTNPPGIGGVVLQNPRGAEVHLAIAPHGQAIREFIDVQTSSPAGSPACACWWVAIVK